MRLAGQKYLVFRLSNQMGVKQLHWQVLDWNEPAINFYKKYPSEFDSEWINCKLNKNQIEKIIIKTQEPR